MREGHRKTSQSLKAFTEERHWLPTVAGAEHGMMQENGKSSHKDIFGDSDSEEEQPPAQSVEEAGESDSAPKPVRNRNVDLFGESDED